MSSFHCRKNSFDSGLAFASSTRWMSFDVRRASSSCMTLCSVLCMLLPPISMPITLTLLPFCMAETSLCLSNNSFSFGGSHIIMRVWYNTPPTLLAPSTSVSMRPSFSAPGRTSTTHDSPYGRFSVPRLTGKLLFISASSGERAPHFDASTKPRTDDCWMNVQLGLSSSSSCAAAAAVAEKSYMRYHLLSQSERCALDMCSLSEK
mmetsp:Transcript_28998/g.72299  ORF Transcript_28998/g.72299 Transcript_28998/m.72299 type:complete len:205 (-) Transcript_28998:635-1249(-)